MTDWRMWAEEINEDYREVNITWMGIPGRVLDVLTEENADEVISSLSGIARESFLEWARDLSLSDDDDMISFDSADGKPSAEKRQKFHRACLGPGAPHAGARGAVSRQPGQGAPIPRRPRESPAHPVDSKEPKASRASATRPYGVRVCNISETRSTSQRSISAIRRHRHSRGICWTGPFATWKGSSR